MNRSLRHFGNTLHIGVSWRRWESNPRNVSLVVDPLSHYLTKLLRGH